MIIVLFMDQRFVTPIVSPGCTERFTHSRLQDLPVQSIFEDIKALSIGYGLPQRESALCFDLTRDYPQIKLIRTEREPLYVAWNPAPSLTRGHCIPNANTDSRPQHDLVEVILAALEHQPDVALADADQFISHEENEAFTQCESYNAGCAIETHSKPPDSCVVPLRGRAAYVA